jgi:hypothetical protein
MIADARFGLLALFPCIVVLLTFAVMSLPWNPLIRGAMSHQQEIKNRGN